MPAGAWWQHNTGVLSRRLPDGWIVLAPDSRDPLLLAGTAARLWDQLDEPSTLASVVDTLVQRYAADRTEVARDVEAALDELTARALVTRGPR